MPYCKPRDTSAAGVNEICRRLAKLVTCLAHEINVGVVDGGITADVHRFNQLLQTKLENEGWSFSYDGGSRLKARPPGHIHPFPRRTK